MKKTARQLALESIISIRKQHKYSNLEIESTLSKNNLISSDKGLYTALVYGVIERTISLDYIISVLSTRPVDSIDESTLVCLELGLYQLKYMTKIPDHAAVNETVSLGGRKSSSFINAILRNFIRREKTVPSPSKSIIDKYLSCTYSFPIDLCAFLIEKIGADKSEAFLKCISESSHDIEFTVNPLKTNLSYIKEEIGRAHV